MSHTEEVCSRSHDRWGVSLYARTSQCVQGWPGVRRQNMMCQCHICDITSCQYSLQLTKRWRRNIQHCSVTHTSLYARVSPHAAASERDLFTLLADFGQHCIFVWFQAAAAFIPALFKDKTKQNISFGVTATISPLLPPAFPILQITSPSPTRSPLPIFCWCIRFKDPSAALVNVWLQTWPTRIIESCTILRPECACVSVSFTSGPNFGCVWRNSQLAINPHSVITQHDWTSFQSGEVFLIPAQLIPICIRLAAAYQTDAAHSSQQEKKEGADNRDWPSEI